VYRAFFPDTMRLTASILSGVEEGVEVEVEEKSVGASRQRMRLGEEGVILY
jgi:hypothetical protein